MKSRLFELEKIGEYVFHGSPMGDMKVLEPRQGRHVPDNSKPTETILDGDPAVSATPYSEIAIFRAIINKQNVPISHTSGFGIRNGELKFEISSTEILDHAKGKIGYVYVFKKDDFSPYDRGGNPRPQNMEWRSYKPVHPLEVIEVTSEDLPDSSRIEVM